MVLKFPKRKDRSGEDTFESLGEATCRLLEKLEKQMTGAAADNRATPVFGLHREEDVRRPKGEFHSQSQS